MTRAALKKQLGLPEIEAQTEAHEWYAKTAQNYENQLRNQGILAHHHIYILKPLGHEIFEEGTTVYAHIRRSTNLYGRAYSLCELYNCIRAHIIWVG